MDQRELVRRAAKGEHEAFDALVRFASNRLYGIAYRILRDLQAQGGWQDSVARHRPAEDRGRRQPP